MPEYHIVGVTLDLQLVDLHQGQAYACHCFHASLPVVDAEKLTPSTTINRTTL